MLTMMKQALKKVGLDLRVQNLDRKPGDRFMEPSGKIWKRGRLSISDDDSNYDTHFRFEWNAKPQMPGIVIDADCAEGEVGLMLEGPIGECWLSFPGHWPIIERVQELAGVDNYESVNVVHATFHHNSFWWEFMHSADSWSPSSTPWWRKASFDFEKLVFGDSEIIDKVIEPVRDIEVAMPEGTYRWTALLKQRTVQRRWTSEVFTIADLNCHEGHQIPVPGKGTMSYNCGPDATYGTHMPARNVEEAIGKLIGGILHDRRRRGGGHGYATGGIHDPEKRKAG